ncbi:sodium:solute symporter family protein [Amycolatopsis sp. NPDC051903]|uniref:sodium:solute symporter family transporter n=1 Tax=Amycolatopsis sp. NPDC051903 TaxID=3363936 RepID=UPI00379341EF
MDVFVFASLMVASLAIAVATRLGMRRVDVAQFLVGGRSFSGWLLFFLSVGEIYSIATLLGFPAGIYAQGAGYGIWFMGYILLAYPIGYFAGPLLWRAAKRYDAMTVPDVMRAHFGSRALEILVAVATVGFMVPYAQFQFAGLHAALVATGFELSARTTVLVSVVLALVYVLLTGIKAPAMISILKDVAMLGAVAVVGVYVVGKSHGTAALFSAGANTVSGSPMVYAISTIVVQSMTFYLGTGGLAFVIAGRSERTVRRTIVVQPLYMLMYPLLVFAAYFSRSHLKLADPNQAFTAAAGATGSDALVGLAAGAASLTGLLHLAVLALGFGGVLFRNLLPAVRRDRQRIGVTLSVAAFLVLSAILAVTVQSLILNVLAFAYAIGAQVVPAWLVVLFAKRVPAASVCAGLICGLALALGLQAAGFAQVAGVNRGLIALALNLLVVFGSAAVLRRIRPAAELHPVRLRRTRPAAAVPAESPNAS